MKRSSFVSYCMVLVAWSGFVPGARAQRYLWTTFAGNDGGQGFTDGPVAQARYNTPAGLATDPNRNVFVADSANRTIRRISAAGVVSTFAGSPGKDGTEDGTGPAARFHRPFALALDPAQNLYVGELETNSIRKITPAGVVTTIPGNFPSVNGIAADGAGNVYIAQSSEQVVRKVTQTGVVTTLAGTAGVGGSVDGTGSAARFNSPNGLALRSDGNLFVTESTNDTIRMVTPGGVVTTFAGTFKTAGSADGTGAAALFKAPRAPAFGPDGTLYVFDGNYTVRKITPGAVVTTLAGSTGNSGWVDGTGTAARFSGGYGLTVLPGSNDVVVTDQETEALRRVTPAGVVTTWTGKPPLTGTTNGTGLNARFRQPEAVGVDGNGNVYVSDAHAIRKITPAGVVTTLAGSPENPGSANGTGTAARFRDPMAIVADPQGNLLVADWGNDTIRKVTPAGVVTTIAGSAGVEGLVNGPAGSARFFSPMGLALDPSGNLYIADQNNHVIRLLSNGVVSTVAGSQPGDKDGTGAAARFVGPSALTRDQAGNFYIADTGNDKVRKMTPGLVVTSLAGTPSTLGAYADGTGANAFFHGPRGLTVDPAGNVIVADVSNNTIRKITPAGVVTTVGGVYGQGRGISDGIGAQANFLSPVGVAAGPGGVLYVADNANARVVRGVPLLPEANEGAETTDEDTAVPVTLTGANPADEPLQFFVLIPPGHGTLSGVPPALVYLPARDYSGTDTFTFRAWDGFSFSSPATITLTVREVNDAPVGSVQDLSLDEDTPLSLTLTGTDVENSALTAAVTASPEHGTLSGTPPALVYNPDANYYGPDSFQFTVRDGELDSTPATVSLTIRPVNDRPEVTLPVADMVQSRPGLATTLDLTAHFRDIETAAAALGYTLEVTGDAGVAAVTVSGTEATVAGAAPGMVTVALTATDEGGLTVSDTFSVRVKHLPEVTGAGIPMQRAILERAPPVVDLAAWFHDADGDALTYELVSNGNPAAAAAALSGPLLTLTGVSPGTAVLTVKATDSDGNSVMQTFPTVAGTEWPTAKTTGDMLLERQTGLVNEWTTVTNTTGLTQTGFRLTVSGIPAGVTLYNATSGPGGGSFYIDYPATMAPDGSVALLLSWLVPDRGTGFTPVISIGELPVPPETSSAGTGLAVDRILPVADGILVEFSATTGRTYEIEYTSDMVTWKRCLTPLHAGASKVQWIDRGPPSTDAPPSTVPARLYRVRDVTP